MAVTYWRTHPPGSELYQYDGPSPEPTSTVRVRKRSRDAIPHGAVAARIKLLQSFILPLPGEPGAPASRRAREDSHAGYGRRLSQRFGNPAIQSAQPDEDSQVEGKHSYLGLNVTRSNHEEEHALADPTIRYTRSPGINGQIYQGKVRRRQHDAASPWEAMSRMDSIPPPSLRGHSPDLDVLKEIDSAGNQTQHISPTSIFPSTAKKDNAGMFSRQVKPRRSRFADSEASIATTSTMRRQNVRDLFDDYGIPRPAGLASREVSRYIDESTYSAEQRTLCHVCFCKSSPTSIKCWRCDHQFCAQCEGLSSQLPTTREENLDYDNLIEEHHGVQKSVPKPKENRVEHDPMKHHHARPGPTPLQYSTMAKPSSPPVMFPDFHDPPKPQKSPRKISIVQSERQVPSPVHLLSGRRMTTSVKESPFLIADQKSRHSLKLVSAGMRGETHHIAHNHHGYHPKRQRLVHYTSTVPSERLSCDSHVCRGTYHSYQPLHNASACPRKKPRHRVPECTENGYIADTSRVDDAVDDQSRCNSQMLEPDPHAQQSGSGYSHLTCTTSGPDSSQSLGMKADCVATHDIPEYVECYGYPRTGHDRHGSPIATGIIGECQHCLDDCQCEACQSTHHSVRCCTHTDHQTIVHQHHTPRKVTLDYSEEQVPPKAEKGPSHVHESHRIQPHNLKGHHQHVPDIHIKEIHGPEIPAQPKDPPKPPPLPSKISNARNENINSTAQAKQSNTKVEKIPEVTEPPSKEYTPLFRPTPELSSFIASAEPTNGTWYTILSEHNHDHVHSRRSSCPPSRKHSLKNLNKAERPGAISSRTQASPQGSRTVSSRQLAHSASFQEKRRERNHSPVEALKQKLLSYREGLQKIQQDCAEQINLTAHSGVAELAQKIEQKAKTQVDYSSNVNRTSSNSSKGTGGSKQKKTWKLKLVDFNPEGKKKGGEEHRLSDDEVVSEVEGYKAEPSVSTAGAEGSFDWSDSSRLESRKEHNLSVDEVVLDQRIRDSGRFRELRVEEGRERGSDVDDEAVRKFEGGRDCRGKRESTHDCVWRERFGELRRTQHERAGLGIRGITVLLHLEGREDLVARVENWTGGELKV